MSARIKAWILAIVLFFLNIPYGIDAPTRAFIQSSSLDQNPVVCRQTQSGAETTFTLSMKQEYRAIQPSYQFSDFTVELFDSMDDVDLSLSGKHYADFQVIDKWAEEPSPYGVTWSVEIKDANDIIKVGDVFTLVVHLKIASGVPAGTYHLAVSPNYAQECIYPNAVVIQ
ncbi:MAG: hypothetical protein IJL00_00195 [Clostridia bacterium]|nr:hypothetical protein [Clostridia bacterium]